MWGFDYHWFSVAAKTMNSEAVEGIQALPLGFTVNTYWDKFMLLALVSKWKKKNKIK